MKKKGIDKAILEEAVKATIENRSLVTEFNVLNPVRSAAASVKGVAGGIKSMGQNVVANYRVGKVKSQMDQFAKKTLNQWEINKNKADAAADDLLKSKNQDAAATGNHIKQQLQHADRELKQFGQKLNQAIPSSAGRTLPQQGQIGQPGMQGQSQLPANLQMAPNMPAMNANVQQSFTSWLYQQGIDPDKLSDRTIWKFFQMFKSQAPVQQAQQPNQQLPATPGKSPKPSRQGTLRQRLKQTAKAVRKIQPRSQIQPQMGGAAASPGPVSPSGTYISPQKAANVAPALPQISKKPATIPPTIKQKSIVMPPPPPPQQQVSINEPAQNPPPPLNKIPTDPTGGVMANAAQQAIRHSGLPEAPEIVSTEPTDVMLDPEGNKILPDEEENLPIDLMNVKSDDESVPLIKKASKKPLMKADPHKKTIDDIAKDVISKSKPKSQPKRKTKSKK